MHATFQSFKFFSALIMVFYMGTGFQNLFASGSTAKKDNMWTLLNYLCLGGYF
jgi:hypothetical protein